MPKISLPSRPTRRFPRILQTAQQLVEVSLEVVATLRLLEPIADIPALRGRCGTRGLYGFHTGQGFSLTAEQIVDNPVPRRGFDKVFKVFTQNRVLLCLLSSRSLTFQFLVVVFLAIEVFTVFTQDRAIPLLRSRSLTIQFHVVALIRSSRFSHRTEFSSEVGADRSHSSSARWPASPRSRSRIASSRSCWPARPFSFGSGFFKSAGNGRSWGFFALFPSTKKCEDPARSVV